MVVHISKSCLYGDNAMGQMSATQDGVHTTPNRHRWFRILLSATTANSPEMLVRWVSTVQTSQIEDIIT